MKNGGKREGAGRPVGSITKPQLSDYITEEEVKALIKKAKEEAKAGRSEMLKFILEQVFGKAKQSMEMSGGLTLDGVIQMIDERNKATNKKREDDVL